MSTTATTPKATTPVKGMALESARAGNIAPRGIVNVSMELCTNIARSTLARVLLNTHVVTTLNMIAVMVNRIMPPEVAAQDGTRNSGRCHRPTGGPG
jgi:hypothetical protein